MSAIPEAVSARGARRGVIRRVVLRLVLLGGFVLAGWLLGAGLALAQDGSGHDDPGYDEFVEQHAGVVQLLMGPSPDDKRSGDLLGAPLTVRSTVQDLLGGSPVRIQPPTQVPILAPALDRVATTMSAPAQPAAHTAQPPATPSRAAMDPPAAVPVTAPAAQDAPRTAPESSVVSTPVGGDRSPATLVSTHFSVAERLAELPSVAADADPVSPAPASPSPVTTTAACLTSGTGGGSSTKSDRSITHSDESHLADVTQAYLRRYPAASDIPQSVAEQPSTSPD